ncbi:MAG TPA: alpha-2-macroglobulin family protein [Ferruginibacter sp.]|nr:alpha-2-macroglobulin family protein [Ferruginibacter sp.]HRO05051.1 alpha-2-macroglobulin family protein [Ferruginibacter sp.]HRO95644.1 alpha-2-macroglobulin family protein [Ferruginibacter sp.]HRP49497.1 alpha-2-macroglobulin family protein [Ferruginibacter sp.]
MKQLFLIGYLCTLSITVMSQPGNNFEKQWKKVTDLEQQGLTASARTEVENIYRLALSTRNEPQQIKGAMYLMKYRTVLEEDSEYKNVRFIDSLLSQTRGAAKQVLYVLKGELLEAYIRNNIYNIRNRTRLTEKSDERIDTWSLPELADAADAAFQSALQPVQLLQSTPVESFIDILQEGNTRNLRPTLYDLLAHRAISYYTGIHSLLVQPEDMFTLNQDELFAPAELFMNNSFNTPDTAAPFHRALVLFQSLLKTHHQKNIAAFADADIKRLFYFKQYAVQEQAEPLYLKALMHMEKAYTHQEAIAAQALYLQALHYYHRGNQANIETQPEYIMDWSNAMTIAEEVIRKFPRTTAADEAYNLTIKINTPYLQMVTEETWMPNYPALALIRYKNASKIHFRVIALNDADWGRLQRLEDKKAWESLTKLKHEKSWSVDLPNPGDYRMHSTEVAIPALSSGKYLLLADYRGDYSMDKNILVAHFIQVNSMMCIHNNHKQFHVLNRATGFPVMGAEVTITYPRNNPTAQTDKDSNKVKLKTNHAGMFEVPLLTQKESYKADIIVQHNNEKLYLTHWQYNYNGYDLNYEPEEETILLFTDRSIYRPGQTVYFKGITLQKHTQANKTTLLKQHEATIELEDANGETLQSATFTSNAYGSFSGSFVLPSSGLTGEFNLYHDESGTSLPIRVEEYKRPTFKNSLQLPDEKYTLWDTLHAKGNAVSYAGVPISNAKVTYTVKRKVNFPYRYWSGGARKPYYGGQERMIGSGVTTTDAQGNYTISFAALPDESIDATLQPYFNFEVHTDITDLQGETRSANVQVNVGYQEILLTPAGPESILTHQLKTQVLSSENLNGAFKSVAVQIQVEEIVQPKNTLRPRLWEVPDQQSMTREEFKKLFPHDPYGDESNRTHWKARGIAMQFTDTTRADQSIRWPAKKLNPGWYRITYNYTGTTGKPVIAEQWVNISGSGSVNEPIQFFTDKDIATPGEPLNVTVKTGWDKIWLIQTTDRMQERNIKQYHTLQAGKDLNQTIQLKEHDRGGMSIQLVFVYQNRVYTAGKDIIVPWSNKELDVRFSTFRDKTLPGQTETFTVHISGDKKQPVASEALISMYDASLDQLYPHQWNTFKPLFPMLSERTYWTDIQTPLREGTFGSSIFQPFKEIKKLQYDKLLPWVYSTPIHDGYERRVGLEYELPFYDEAVEDGFYMSNRFRYSSYTGAATKIKESSITPADNLPVFTGKIRTDFRETAFFYPQLVTDKNGDISFTFTTPESLTQWRMMALAHTADLESGYAEKNMTTHLPLMTQLNAPRFFREADHLEIPVKISNTSDSAFSGTVQLELIDAQTEKAVDGWFQNVFPTQYFTAEAQQSSVVHFPVQIPVNYNSALKIRVKAVSQNGKFSDGEEHVFPVMTNRTLVTEAMPFTLRNTNELKLQFDKLIHSGKSSTLKHHALTVEYTSNPIWYAIQALPYLMEYPYECSEQIFSRYYANSLASFIVHKTPAIRKVFDQWQQLDTTALMSNLLKNQELKSALLEETPWVLDARNESAQKKNIALLFNLTKLVAEQENTVKKLEGLQNENGSFSWFKNGPDNPWITQHILTGLGRLNQLLSPDSLHPSVKNIITKGLPYLNEVLVKAHAQATKNKKSASANHLTPLIIHHLYMRTLYPDAPANAAVQKAVQYFMQQEKKYWNSQSLYMKAMIAITLHKKEPKTAKAIVRSMKENAIYHNELGMYWKSMQQGGYFWHEAPVETMSMILTAFHQMNPGDKDIQELSVWLLKNKQTTHWKTTKATTDAVYALLLADTSLHTEPAAVDIQLGNQSLVVDSANAKAGTGYFNTRIEGRAVDASMGNIRITRTTPHPKNMHWGGVYWQYFEDLDQITGSALSPLTLKRNYFTEHQTPAGPVLKPIEDGASVSVGSKIIVRVILQTDRDMEYLHLKDMRVSGMEPVNVLSGYKYSHNLGYYESTKDLASHFFIDYLPKGTYVFEYALFATHAGDFSSGISSIQSMYAPEFNSHSDGIRIQITGEE